MAELLLSDKYKAFLSHEAPVEMLEGTTFAGKTTVGIFKFMLMVAESDKKLHIIAAEDTGTAEKNLINKELGIIDDFGVLAEYNGNGTSEHKIPHIVFHTNKGDKIIYVMGYGDKRKWKKALGGQYGCLYIDEINTADIEFVREAAMRCDYFMGTLNPDDPNLPVYDEYINHCRPLPEYEQDAPKEINEMLDEQEPKPGWVHWFFSFADNAAVTEEKVEQIKTNVPKGTKLWKNKILGLRGKATGLVFSNFEKKKHVVSVEYAKNLIKNEKNKNQKEWFVIFTAGVDTSYSSKSADTIAFNYTGITNRGRCIVLDEKCYNNSKMHIPIAPSDTCRNLVDFMNRNKEEWGFTRNVFVDSADAATLTELEKYKREHGCIYNFIPSYKKTKIVDRINLQLGWLAKEQYLIVSTCKNLIGEMESYSWDEKKDNEPEDKNDHMINSTQYAWLPYKKKIGGLS